jgi:hypothetical protein
VYFVEYEHIRVNRPGLIANNASVDKTVVIKILGMAEFLHQVLREPGFADLPRPGKDNHFLVKVLFYDIIEITVHTDYLAALCGKVKTFPQSAAFWSSQ